MKSSLGREKRPQKIGLALGSGSARGWAHIGLIQALAKMDIRVDYVAGTSIGALVGAFYAAGRINTLKEFALNLDRKQILCFFDVVLPKSGLIDGKKVADFLRSYVKGINIEDLSLPFRAVSTDISTGREVLIREGDIIEAVRASISVPGIFTPVRKNGVVLVDGGLVNPVPVSVVREMGAEFVIALDLNHDIVGKKGAKKNTGFESAQLVSTGEAKQDIAEKNKFLNALNEKLEALDFSSLNYIKQWMSRDPLPNIFEVLISSINIMETQITVSRMITDPPDLLIQPNLGHIKFLEFNRAEEAIEAGYQEAMAKIKLLSGKQ